MLRIQRTVVVSWAAIVPMGIDFWASFKSPDLLDPAIIPVEKKDINYVKLEHNYMYMYMTCTYMYIDKEHIVHAHRVLFV